MPLNEDCGLLEWVNHTLPLKTILDKGYARQGKKVYVGQDSDLSLSQTTELHTTLETARRSGPAEQIKTFRYTILPMYAPTVFHVWFLSTWPEPSAWLASRTAYSRTLAAMSMVGYVLGYVESSFGANVSLGDRHGENILFDSTTGDTVHVDLNCLFDKVR
jgi:serine/threonine-protein kinase ATR